MDASRRAIVAPIVLLLLAACSAVRVYRKPVRNAVSAEAVAVGLPDS
ncbi:MAG TPA: hypothetical protein VMP08_10290 [Anaerolineae bacterium]|nr:hypothetical protein [Anaerolineae bacterium]